MPHKRRDNPAFTTARAAGNWRSHRLASDAADQPPADQMPAAPDSEIGRPGWLGMEAGVAFYPDVRETLIGRFHRGERTPLPATLRGKLQEWLVVRLPAAVEGHHGQAEAPLLMLCACRGWETGGGVFLATPHDLEVEYLPWAMRHERMAGQPASGTRERNAR